jgi:hypothetical protein
VNRASQELPVRGDLTGLREYIRNKIIIQIEIKKKYVTLSIAITGCIGKKGELTLPAFGI